MRACPSSCWPDMRSACASSMRFGSAYTNSCSSRSRAARSRPVCILCWTTPGNLAAPPAIRTAQAGKLIRIATNNPRCHPDSKRSLSHRGPITPCAHVIQAWGMRPNTQSQPSDLAWMTKSASCRCRTTSSPSIRARPRRAPSCSTRRWRRSAIAQQEFPQIYPAPGWVEHDPEDIWATRGRDRARRRWRRPASGAQDVAAHRHHQSARNHGHLGPRDRQADPQRHRLAGPPHRRGLRGAARARATRSAIARTHRAAARSVFLRHQNRLAARPCAGRARRGAKRASSPSARSTPFCSGA